MEKMILVFAIALPAIITVPLRFKIATTRDCVIIDGKERPHKLLEKFYGEDSCRTSPYSLSVSDGLATGLFSTIDIANLLSISACHFSASQFLLEKFSDDKDFEDRFLEYLFLRLIDLQKNFARSFFKLHPSKFLPEQKMIRLFDKISMSSAVVSSFIDNGSKDEHKSILRVFQKGDCLLVVLRKTESKERPGFFSYIPVFMLDKQQIMFQAPHHFSTIVTNLNILGNKSLSFEIEEDDIVIAASNGLFDNFFLSFIVYSVNLILLESDLENGDYFPLGSLMAENLQKYFEVVSNKKNLEQIENWLKSQKTPLLEDSKKTEEEITQLYKKYYKNESVMFKKLAPYNETFSEFDRFRDLLKTENSNQFEIEQQLLLKDTESTWIPPNENPKDFKIIDGLFKKEQTFSSNNKNVDIIVKENPPKKIRMQKISAKNDILDDFIDVDEFEMENEELELREASAIEQPKNKISKYSFSNLLIPDLKKQEGQDFKILPRLNLDSFKFEDKTNSLSKKIKENQSPNLFKSNFEVSEKPKGKINLDPIQRENIEMAKNRLNLFFEQDIQEIIWEPERFENSKEFIHPSIQKALQETFLFTESQIKQTLKIFDPKKISEQLAAATTVLFKKYEDRTKEVLTPFHILAKKFKKERHPGPKNDDVSVATGFIIKEEKEGFAQELEYFEKESRKELATLYSNLRMHVKTYMNNLEEQLKEGDKKLEEKLFK